MRERNFVQTARDRQAKRIKELTKERDRLISLIAAGLFGDDPDQLARARANVKFANYSISSYRQGRRAR